MRATINLSVILLALVAWAVAHPFGEDPGHIPEANRSSFLL